MQSTPSPVTFKSGLYWQRNPVLGFLSEPVILTLGNGLLSLTGRKDTVFQASGAQVRAKFSKMGTMALTVDGKRYSIAGIGGTLAPKFTPAQLQEIDEAARAADALTQSGSEGTPGESGFGVAGR